MDRVALVYIFDDKWNFTHAEAYKTWCDAVARKYELESKGIKVNLFEAVVK